MIALLPWEYALSVIGILIASIVVGLIIGFLGAYLVFTLMDLFNEKYHYNSSGLFSMLILYVSFTVCLPLCIVIFMTISVVLFVVNVEVQ